jgi:hypothetical protein
MLIRGEGLMDANDQPQATDHDQQKLVYVLHPNCAIEEM